MRFTFDRKGKYNKNYWSCLVWFDLKKDNHVRHIKTTNEVNLMFKHSEIADIIKHHLIVEPKSKRTALSRMFEIAIQEGLKAEQEYNADSETDSE